MSATVPPQSSSARPSGSTPSTRLAEFVASQERLVLLREKAMKMIEQGHQTFTKNMQTLFRSDKGDVTIVGSDRSWNVHSSIIGANCEFLRAACEGPFKEAQTRNIQMIYDDPIALESLLEFLYTGTYTDLNDIMGNDLGGCRRDVEWNELLKKHAEVFTLADKYGVVTLKKLAAAAINIAATELSAFA